MPKGSPIDIKGLRHLSTTFKKFYPGTLVKAIVFPIGPLTPILWRMAKVFLGKRTTAKVVLMPGGSTPAGLATFISPELIPSLFLSKDAQAQLVRTEKPSLLPVLEGDASNDPRRAEVASESRNMELPGRMAPKAPIGTTF